MVSRGAQISIEETKDNHNEKYTLRKRIFNGIAAVATLSIMYQFGEETALAQKKWTLKDLEKNCADFASRFGSTRILDYSFINVYNIPTVFSATFAPSDRPCITNIEEISFSVHRKESDAPVRRPRLNWHFKLSRVVGDEFGITEIITDCEKKIEEFSVKAYQDSGVIVSPEFAIKINKNATEQQCPALEKAVGDAILNATHP